MKDMDRSGHGLKKVLGVSFGIAVVIGGTIGVGILRTPGTIAGLVPNAWLILMCWMVAGLYILLAASSYAELTTMLPKAGGSYNYIKRAFGDYAGFLSGWFDFIMNVIAPAYFCIVLGEYSARLLPGLAGYETAVAVGFLTFFTLLHLPGVKSGSALQQATSAIKVVLFLVLIVGCFLSGGGLGEAAGGSADTTAQGGLLLGIFGALQLIMGAYNGWGSVSFFAEEDKDPGKNVPRSYFIGVLSVMTLYLLITAAIHFVLPVPAVAQSSLPVADAAGVVFGQWGATFITFFALFSVVSILNAYLMIPSRILFGLSRDRFFIRGGTYVNKGGTPVVALLICYVISTLLILFSTFEQLFALGAFIGLIVAGLGFLSLLRLRQKEPGLPRPYRVWGYPYSTLVALLVTLSLFVAFAVRDRANLLAIAAIALLSYPCFLWLRRSLGKSEEASSE